MFRIRLADNIHKEIGIKLSNCLYTYKHIIIIIIKMVLFFLFSFFTLGVAEQIRISCEEVGGDDGYGHGRYTIRPSNPLSTISSAITNYYILV